MTTAIKVINEGSICSPKGFKANGIHCGIRGNISKKDLALIVSEVPCNAAAVYTQNKVFGAPITVTRNNIADGKAQAIICNSGNANTCAPGGIKLAEDTCELTAKALGLQKEDIIVASTGVIGQAMTMDPFEKGMPELVAGLTEDGAKAAAEAIMTTDTVPKYKAVEFMIGDATCTIGGIAKGSGMINPNMATMLSFITTDVAISSEMLQKALSADIKKSFNQICVDGDTSTNDTVALIANGMAGNEVITEEGEAFEAFASALAEVTQHLAKNMAKDGEGATKLIECNVKGAPDQKTANAVSKTVISSNLLKCAIFGSDANWGRVLCAIGYCEGDFSADNIDVEMSSKVGKILVCKGSMHNEYSEDFASQILAEDEIIIDINLNDGDAEGTAWGCDLTYDYVQINGDYRS